MTNESTPERIRIDQYGQRLYDEHPRKLEGVGYVREDVLATRMKEEREATFKEALEIAKAEAFERRMAFNVYDTLKAKLTEK